MEMGLEKENRRGINGYAYLWIHPNGNTWMIMTCDVETRKGPIRDEQSNEPRNSNKLFLFFGAFHHF